MCTLLGLGRGAGDERKQRPQHRLPEAARAAGFGYETFSVQSEMPGIRHARCTTPLEPRALTHTLDAWQHAHVFFLYEVYPLPSIRWVLSVGFYVSVGFTPVPKGLMLCSGDRGLRHVRQACLASLEPELLFNRNGFIFVSL